MLDAVEGFSKSKKNGVFINSCFAHVQTERKGMWFAYDSPMIGNKVLCVFGGTNYVHSVFAITSLGLSTCLLESL
ncbi:hypothetical protein Sjap_006806 [Stephania japonica]|uniref:Pectin acetylesterase n=1 Tax=Stephania japonica TaxID=461633 RepID=A0AAP0PJA4_9MAGN